MLNTSSTPNSVYIYIWCNVLQNGHCCYMGLLQDSIQTASEPTKGLILCSTVLAILCSTVLAILCSTVLAILCSTVLAILCSTVLAILCSTVLARKACRCL